MDFVPELYDRKTLDEAIDAVSTDLVAEDPLL
jgi:hypothetical protein